MTVDQDKAPWICVAAVATAHGVRGALRLRCFTEKPEDVAAYGPLFDQEGHRLFELTILGRAKDGVIAKADGIDDRDAAEALRGTELFVPRSALPDPGDDEFYYEDLQGLTAVSVDANPIGIVKQVANYGAGDLIEVTGDDGASRFFPFDKATVLSVDLAKGQLIIEPRFELVVEPET